MMKLAVLLACVVGVVLAGLGKEEQCSSEITKLCPETDPSVPVFIADPDDCTAYCECSAGTAWRFHCAPGTAFDEDLDLCTWIDDVDCGDRPGGNNSTLVY